MHLCASADVMNKQSFTVNAHSAVFHFIWPGPFLSSGIFYSKMDSSIMEHNRIFALFGQVSRNFWPGQARPVSVYLRIGMRHWMSPSWFSVFNVDLCINVEIAFQKQGTKL